MSTRQVVRFLAACSIIGGVSRAAMTPLALALGLNSIPELIFGVLGTMFMGVGMIGLYMPYIRNSGRIGFASFAVHTFASFLLMALVFGSLTFRVYEPAMLDSPTPPLPVAVTGLTSMPLLILSMVLIPIWIFRTKIYSKLPAVLLLATPFINFIPSLSDIGPLLWGFAFVWFGIEAWKRAGLVETITTRGGEERRDQMLDIRS